MNYRRFISLCYWALLLNIQPAMANAIGEASPGNGDFILWLQGVRQQALLAGVSQHTLDTAFTGIDTPLRRVIELDRAQPEVKLTFADYLARVVTRQRVRQGRNELERWRKLLNRVTSKYPVPAHYLVALWGMETDFGRLSGGFNAVEALTTLAYDGRRSAFFRSELLNALKILDEGHTTAKKMKGSWAGAMGHMQFMPSTFLRFAVDMNGDGKKDIWNSLSDSFASGANYLSSIGWNPEQTWGEEVTLAAPIDKQWLGTGVTKTVSEWQAVGVSGKNGAPLQEVNDEQQASLIALDGPHGRYFLVYQNFRMLMDWNRSEKYATAVCLLADAIKPQ